MGTTDRGKLFGSYLKMDTTVWLSLVIAVVTFSRTASSTEPRVVCYYTNWSVYRPGSAKFNPQNINPYLCTHLIYAFGGFTKENTLKPFDKYQDIEKGGYAKFTGLKTYNKNLKTLLAIGGWNEGSARFSPMVASKERRKEFVRNAIKFLRQNRFDGLDLDWEYPAFRDGGKPKDRENYAKLVKELREEFEREAEKTGKPRLLLTMAVPAGIEYIQKGFDVKTLNDYLDWMNLLTYDYHSAFEPAVNHHAPLYPLEEQNEYSVDNELNIDYTIKFYLENGADPDKLVLGIPTYGRSYTLFNPDATEIGSPADGPGEQGDATREKGYLAYYEICEALKPKEPKQKKPSSDEDDDDDDDEDEDLLETQSWTVVQPNPNALGPYAYKGNQWVGYDDLDIVRRKAEYVAEKGLGGIMFWSIDNDDFRGKCHGKPYPLIEAAKEAYIASLGSTNNAVTEKSTSSSSTRNNRRKSRPTTRSTTTTTERPASKSKLQSNSITSTTPSWNIITPEPPTTPDPGSDFKCKEEGFFQHPRDCKKYFWCLDSGPSNLGIVAHQFTCPSGLYFNKATDSCDFARNVLCKTASSTTKAPTTKYTTKEYKPTTTTTLAPSSTTTRKPLRLSTKNSLLFRTTSTTTTTPEPEPIQEEEKYDEEADEGADVEAEDPRVIKELIDLIKKVGGVEQLEKHLQLSSSSGRTHNSDSPSTTPVAFNKRLYQKVLERTRGKIKPSLGSPSLVSGEIQSPNALTYQNSRRSPQNAGLGPERDRDTLVFKDRPQYTTIQRNRPSTSTTEEPLENNDSTEDIEIPIPSNQNQNSYVPRMNRVVDTPKGTPKPLQYVNIRRARPTSDTADDTASRNALFERPESIVTVSEPTLLDISSARRENMPEYVTIRRQRPTTEEATTVQYGTEPQEDDQDTLLERELSSPSTSSNQPQYSTIKRGRPTTTPLPEPNSNKSTTVLDVKIASLLNSGLDGDEDDVTDKAETVETDPITTPVTTTTTSTTTTTTPAPSSVQTRRTILRRRGSTTTTVSPPSSTSQVSTRNNAFTRRRRPVAKPNEIVPDSDDSTELARKIRSTTPDSREIDNPRAREPSQFRPRSRVRIQAPVEDSVPAAAAQISRGQFRPQLSRDEVLSLTPIDVEVSNEVQKPSFVSRNQIRYRGRGFTRASTTEASVVVEASGLSLTPVDIEPPQFISRQTAVRNDRRFRGRASTVANLISDSEASAATADVKPTIASRGQNRFRPGSTAASAEASLSTEATIAPRRPYLPRLTPRPFTRASPTVSDEEAETSTQRIFSGIPFSRSRPVAIPDSSTSSAVLQPRRLPFPSRQITTPQVLTNESEEYSEEKNDDIHLSESAIEEKEHEGQIDDIEEPPKRRVVIKKFRNPSSSTENPISTESVSTTDENGRKKIKIIRRRPSSTTETLENTSTSPELPSSTPSRIRKVIRKKVKPIENEPEIIAKSIGSLNTAKDVTTEIIANYGEKNRVTIPTTPAPEEAKQDESEILDRENEVNVVEPVEEQNQIKNKENNAEKEEIIGKSPDEMILSINNLDKKPEVAIETEQQAVENKGESGEESDEDEESKPVTTTPGTTQQTSPSSPSTRGRVPYRPPKRLFTSTTESTSSSPRTFSRKYNPGAYTSPATLGRASESGIRASTRRTLFSSKTFTRRPITTARTTTKVEEEEEDEYYDEEIEEQPENSFVLVPQSQLFSRRPNQSTDADEDERSEEILEEEDEVPEEEEEKPNRFRPSSRRPAFSPRVVNSNTFRTSSSTTELPKRPTSLNRTAIYNRLGGSKQSNDTKKRVQNVPVGYNATTSTEKPNSEIPEEESGKEENFTPTTNSSTVETTTEDDDDYLSMTGTSTQGTTTNDFTSTNTVESETATIGIEIDESTDDYLEFTENATNDPTTQDSTINTQAQTEPESSTTQETTTMKYVPEATSSTITTTSTTTTAPEPIVKTQYNKLFSVRRTVEINSKLDKHKLNKKNETRLVEEGEIMVEKKPREDKIGEVSRFSLIKIFEDEIPIYLTKLGHVYPVENPPDNPIRIDEARNARALMNFADSPRENLIASESMNEAYRHINLVTNQPKDDVEPKTTVERVKSDDFLTYINDDRKTDKSDEELSFRPWQFVPAAYENEKRKAAKKYEIVTPRSMLTEPSTLSLEALFKTETPTARKISDTKANQPFVVYSASIPSQKEEANIVKLSVIQPESSKSETGRSIITFAKGQEFKSASVTEEGTVRSPIYISVIPRTTEMIPTPTMITETLQTSPIMELLTTVSSTVFMTTEIPTTIISTTEASSTETVTEETTTTKTVFDAKRSKFAFPRRNILRPNITRPSPVPRTVSKANATVLNNSLKKPNKTISFNPTKTRITGNRAQNVPIDVRNRITTKQPRVFTTSAPRSTTERRVSIKPLRAIRPAFVPRRSTTQLPTTVSDT